MKKEGVLLLSVRILGTIILVPFIVLYFLLWRVSLHTRALFFAPNLHRFLKEASPSRKTLGELERQFPSLPNLVFTSLAILLSNGYADKSVRAEDFTGSEVDTLEVVNEARHLPGIHARERHSLYDFGWSGRSMQAASIPDHWWQTLMQR